jgi:hypothetical protein
MVELKYKVDEDAVALNKLLAKLYELMENWNDIESPDYTRTLIEDEILQLIKKK